MSDAVSTLGPLFLFMYIPIFIPFVAGAVGLVLDGLASASRGRASTFVVPPGAGTARLPTCEFPTPPRSTGHPNQVTSQVTDGRDVEPGRSA